MTDPILSAVRDLRASVDEYEGAYQHKADGPSSPVWMAACGARLRAVIRAFTAATGGEWQDIATAPKDRDILVYRPKCKPNAYIPQVGTDWWKNDCWQNSNASNQPTHWQPLPEPPKEKQE